MKFLRLPLLLLVLVSLLLMAFAQPEDVSDLVAVLTWLALGPGAMYIAGQAMSHFVEKVPGWASRVPEVLRPFIVLLLAVGLAYGARLLLAQTEIVAAISPEYTFIVGIIVAWLGSQREFGRLKFNGLLQRRKEAPA